MNMFYLYAAVLIMLIIIVSDFLKRKYNIDLNNVHASDFKLIEKVPTPVNKAQVAKCVIQKGTGESSLVLVNPGKNKATVMATLRQITGLDYNSAKSIVEGAPTIFMEKISVEEANLTKKALEFVGAKVDLR